MERWPTVPSEFINEYVRVYKKFKGIEEDVEHFKIRWEANLMNHSEKLKIIETANLMAKKGYKDYPDIFTYTQTALMQKEPDCKVKINSENFNAVTDSCIEYLTFGELFKYFNYVKKFMETGKVFETSVAYWKFNVENAKLKFVKQSDEFSGSSTFYPSIVVENTNLEYKSNKDSTVVNETSGNVNILTNEFKGNGGTITWEKMQLDPADVYVKLLNFDVNLNYPKFEADSVIFYYHSLLNKPLFGNFIDINQGYTGDIDNANYPYFKSVEGGIVIEEFMKNVQYTGGFSFKGVKKIGSSTDIEVARINIENTNGVKRMSLTAEEFVLDTHNLKSNESTVVLYLPDGDTLYHPSMTLDYNVDTGDITLHLDISNNKKSRQPIFSSYHNFNLYFRAIKWRADKDSIAFSFLIDAENTPGAIESIDFFYLPHFRGFKGVLKFNPLAALYRYKLKYPKKEIYIDPFLKFMGKENQKNQLKYVLIDLDGSGFIEYDGKAEKITLLPRGIKWAKAAKSVKDHDKIQLISSITGGTSMYLDTNTKFMHANGIQPFSLSDSNFIWCHPYKEKTTFGKNREIDFGGIVRAGKLNLYGYEIDSIFTINNLIAQKEYQINKIKTTGGIALLIDTLNADIEKLKERLEYWKEKEAQSNKPPKNFFSFNYDGYKVICDTLDSLKFILVRNPPENFKFTPLQIALRKMVLQDINGAVYINKPNNKSGKKPHPEYMVFDSYTNCYKYWDEKGVQNGVYNKDSLFFSLDPFIIDSLETFDENALRFHGEFFSSNIFPKFRQTLKPMPDQTMGFEEQTPEEGYEVYEGKGKFYNKIMMDNSSLRGDGKIEYLATIAESDSFVFHFDSVMTVTTKFYQPEGEFNGAFYPEISANKVVYTWYTKKDELHISSMGEPVALYGGNATFDGTIKITPKGTLGSGTLTIGQSKITSDHLILDEKDFQTNGGDFSVAYKSDPTKLHFTAKKVDIDYDVKQTTAKFNNTSIGKANNEFFALQYKTSLGKGFYDEKNGKIYLSSTSTYGKDNFFISTNPALDSLKFIADSCVYDMKTETIDIDGANQIIVADATVFPDSGKVKIAKNSVMQTLTNAKVICNNQNKYHEIYEATINIASKNSYSGSGKITYRKVDSLDQVVMLKTIQVLNDTTTYAYGEVLEKDSLLLQKRIYYKGKVELKAENKFLSFSGLVKIQSSNPYFANAWFPYKENQVDPDNIYIPIPEDPTRKIGLAYIADRRIFYSLFMQELREKTHSMILNAVGGLDFDEIAQEFRIGLKNKMNGTGYRGALVRYNDSTRTITTTGYFKDFPYHFDIPDIKVKMAGSVKEDGKKNKINADFVWSLDWIDLPKSMTKLANKVKLFTTSSEPADYSQRTLLEGLSEFIDEGLPISEQVVNEKGTVKLLNEVKKNSQTGDVKIAKDLPSALLLYGANFQWSKSKHSFYLNGEINLIGISGVPINRKLSAKIEYRLGRPAPNKGQFFSDKVSVSIQIDPNNWVFYQFVGNELRIGASADLSDALAMIKEEVDKKNKKNKEDKPGMVIKIVTDYEKEAFEKDFVKDYIIGK